MPVTLVEARRNAQTDLDVAVIDEFRKESVLLDSLVFDDAVNPSGGGATLTMAIAGWSPSPRRRSAQQRGTLSVETNTAG